MSSNTFNSTAARLVVLADVTFTFMYLADAFIQSDLQLIQVIHLLSVCVFPGNVTQPYASTVH